MKQILFISTIDSSIHKPTLKGLIHLGFGVHFVDFRGSPVLLTSSLVHKIVGRLPLFLTSHLITAAHRKINARVLKIAQNIRPDYIFVMKAKNLDVAVLEELRKIAPTINWYADMLDNWQTWQRIVTHYDYMFNYDNHLIQLLHNQGHTNVYHLPWAGYIDKRSKWPDIKEPKYNVVFIGSYHPIRFPRQEIVSRLKPLGLHIWGNKAWLNTEFKDCYHGYVTPTFEEIDKVYRQAKIAIYLDSLHDVTGTGITLRPFEITSAGAMMIGQVCREELFSLFEPGKEFISFHGVDDMIEKIQYYLAHDDERRAVARAGFERTRSEHTYEDRLAKIFSIVDNTR